MEKENKWFKATIYFYSPELDDTYTEEKKSRTKEGLERNIKKTIAFEEKCNSQTSYITKEIIYH